MAVKLAYIQSENGIPAKDPFYRAWDGFRKRGIRCELFEAQQLRDKTLPLTRETLVVGAVSVFEGALATLGVPVPPADNLPECLAQYRGRRVWISTWGELRWKYSRKGPPQQHVWVKSLRRNKGAPSLAVCNSDDLAPAARLPDSHEVLVSEYVLFDSEWRCFVCNGRILDVCRYQGEIFRYPDPKVVQNAVAGFTKANPAACGIDFGVLVDGRTVLVEVNEGYSLNPFGLDASDYAELLETRWLQLVTQTAGRS